MQMNLDEAVALIAAEPFTEWTWTEAERRRLGIPAPGGAAVDLWASEAGQLTSVSALVLLPPDSLILAARNGQLLAWLLSRLCPSWPKSEAWIVAALNTAARAPAIGAGHQVVRDGWKITFRVLAGKSQATLTLEAQ
jgi:hypothetical protein